MQIIGLLILAFGMAFFYFKMIQPFVRRIGQESRRVAVLLSHLPTAMDVEGGARVYDTSFVQISPILGHLYMMGQ